MRKFHEDNYALYKDVQFRCTKFDEDSAKLVSMNPSSKSLGFTLEIPDEKFKNFKTSDVYIKVVLKKDLQDLYRINYYVEYEELSFQIVTTNALRKTITIGTNNAEIARKYDFIRPDKYYFEKELPMVEVQVVEEKIDLLNEKGVVDFKYVNE